MKRNQTLDIFRAVAFLLVFFSHIFGVRTFLFNHSSSIIIKALTTIQFFFIYSSDSGVELFFVLSGFLISGLIFSEYDKTGDFKPGRFLLRRAFKIYPLYYLLLITYFGICLLTQTSFYQKDFFAESFFFINYFHSADPPLGHLWSVAVEEHFYFTLSFLFLLLLKLGKLNLKTMFITYGSLFICTMLYRYLSHLDSTNWWSVYPQSHHRIDNLFAGVLLSYLYRYHKIQFASFLNRYKKVVIPSCLFILIANAYIFLPLIIRHVLLLGINSICYGLLLIYFLHFKWIDGKKIFNPLVFIGKNSYALYLCHVPILMYIKTLPISNGAFYLLTTISTFIIAILATRYIETPILKFRDQYFPAAKKPTARNVKELQPASV